jgi:carboxypeptidase Taq
MSARLDELKARLQEVHDLDMASAVLRWDQATYMPPGGSEARGRQLATLGRLSHEKFTDPALGRLLDQAEHETRSFPSDSDGASLVRVTRREYDRAVKVPPAFVSELSEHTTRAYQTWTEARPANDFARVRPLLERTLDLSRRLADFFPGYESIADPLIDYSDHGMKASTVRPVFAELRERLVPLVRAITAKPAADDSCLHQHAPEAEQLAFGLEVIGRFGYDFERGRQDKTHHPFMTRFSVGDVRITTRVREDDLTDALFSTLHECGHALYEQGIRRDYEGTPLADGTSAGVHESQSRLWENLVGRSHGFWEHFYPRLQDAFPAQMGHVPLETFYRAINKVQRSLIRTDADEVTYNLHVMLRFDLELDLLEGRLAVKDLPGEWRSRMKADLGVEPPDDKDGVLQDVHWFAGIIGGQFQGYTLGNILSAQFYEAATRAHPGIPGEIVRGEFGTLHAWLRENIYQHGAKFTASELIERATGCEMGIEPYIAYLHGKYGPLYELAEAEVRTPAGRPG